MFEFIHQLHQRFTEAGLADPLQETLHLCDILSGGALRALDGRSPANIMPQLSLEEIVTQRQQGMPLEYILQQTIFMGRPFTCTPDTLIPRAETELLVQTVLNHATTLNQETLTIVDVGTGSGNIAVSLALELPHSRVYALDISPEATAAAQTHVAQYALQERVTVCCGDLFAPLANLGLENQVDIVVCNPPYIPSGSLEKMSAEIIDHEPIVALDAGPYGINIFRRLVRDTLTFLRPDGLLAFEFGAGQEVIVQRLLQKSGGYTKMQPVVDHLRRPRVFVAQTAVPESTT
ncbi:peptide chain release factor N(5)-glutamine methyltransferase [Candidatus Leptofilum sp.]|uniref:peptide chain release factor N(5)-glutamine methyltransferase n=1 Tax=Candidatus Leptofilum sp. TaxID=3241576 RepID=UPI003B5995F2